VGKERWARSYTRTISKNAPHFFENKTFLLAEKETLLSVINHVSNGQTAVGQGNSFYGVVFIQKRKISYQPKLHSSN
jgi:hypothetical protein